MVQPAGSNDVRFYAAQNYNTDATSAGFDATTGFQVRFDHLRGLDLSAFKAVSGVALPTGEVHVPAGGVGELIVTDGIAVPIVPNVELPNQPSIALPNQPVVEGAVTR